MPSYKLSIMNLGAGGKLVGRRGHDPALRGAEVKGGRVAERSESSNPMIASGNHTDSNSDRPYRVLRTIRVDRAMCQKNRPLGTRPLGTLSCFPGKRCHNLPENSVLGNTAGKLLHIAFV